MTIDEAKDSLKALCHTCKHFPTCVNDKPECFHAIDMAIKSLEAWGKVENEIMDLRDNDLFEYVSNYALHQTVWEIVDKHLWEVEHEADN